MDSPRWFPRPRLHLVRFHGVLAKGQATSLMVIPNVPVNARG